MFSENYRALRATTASDNNSTTTKFFFWMTIMKLYNKCLWRCTNRSEKRLIDIYGATNERSSAHVSESPAPLTNRTRVQINTSVCLPRIPSSRDATCPWYHRTQPPLTFCL